MFTQWVGGATEHVIPPDLQVLWGSEEHHDTVCCVISINEDSFPFNLTHRKQWEAICLLELHFRLNNKRTHFVLLLVVYTHKHLVFNILSFYTGMEEQWSYTSWTKDISIDCILCTKENPTIVNSPTQYKNGPTNQMAFSLHSWETHNGSTQRNNFSQQ